MASSSNVPSLDLPADVADVIVLRPGERILWTDRPHAWPRLDGRWVRGRLKIIAWMILPILVLMAGTDTSNVDFAASQSWLLLIDPVDPTDS